MKRKFKPNIVISQKSDGTVAFADLYHAAFFVARGHQIVGLEPQNRPGRFDLLIAPGETFARDVGDWNRNVPVPILDFLNALYDVRRRLFGPKGQYHGTEVGAESEPGRDGIDLKHRPLISGADYREGQRFNAMQQKAL
jgi:hypothetical protein